MVRGVRTTLTLAFYWATVIEVVFATTGNTTYVRTSLPSAGPTNQTHNSTLEISTRDISTVNDDVTASQNHSLRCIPNPCLHQRVCSVIPNGYRCECPDGWMGIDCITRITCSTNNPCLNKGRCYENGSEILSCVCPLGFTGPRCEYEIATPCDSDPCVEGKICVEYGPTSYRCQCPEGYTGDDCELRRVSCIPNPCENNATCVASLWSGLVSCLCREGYIGRRCHFKDLCKQNPCANGGTCEMDPNSGKADCKCLEGYHGHWCENADKCHPNPCLYAGSCSEINGTAICFCREGFRGDTCELHECNPNPCLNGGVCKAVPGTDEYTCVCTHGYTGKNCEYDPCYSNPCLNGGVCTSVKSSYSWYTCQCKPGWQGDNCDIVTSPTTMNRSCDPNPCKNGCQCKPSCRHENGYICVGSEGQLGKNCDLPAPSIKCGSNEIVVGIDRRIVSEYGGRYPDVEVFMSNSSSIATSPGCQATSNKTELQFNLSLPFNDCGTVTSTMSDGTISVTNTIWMNKLFAPGAFEIPVPVVTFVCQYGVEYHVVTSLSPSLGHSRLVAGKGKRTVPADIELCKSGDSCPQACPQQFSLTRGAVYTVGERLHLRISPQTRDTTLRIQDLFLSCSSNETQEQDKAPVVSIVSECMPTKSPRYNPTEVVQFSNGLCISFRVPFLPECGVFYIHAKLKSCSKNCSSYYGECQDRRRRSVAAKETLEVFGPIYVLRGDDGVLKTILYPGDDDLDSDSSHPTIEAPKDVDTMQIQLRIAVLIMVMITVFMLSVFLCCRQCNISSKRHYYTDH